MKRHCQRRRGGLTALLMPTRRPASPPLVVQRKRFYHAVAVRLRHIFPCELNGERGSHCLALQKETWGKREEGEKLMTDPECEQEQGEKAKREAA